MSMSIHGQELLINTLTKLVVDVAIQKDEDYNLFIDAIITSLLYMAQCEKLWDDYEVHMAVSMVNVRAKEMLDTIEFDDDKPSYESIDDIINTALNNLKNKKK